jgi:hypothetical protein
VISALSFRVNWAARFSSGASVESCDGRSREILWIEREKRKKKSGIRRGGKRDREDEGDEEERERTISGRLRSLIHRREQSVRIGMDSSGQELRHSARTRVPQEHAGFDIQAPWREKGVAG